MAQRKTWDVLDRGEVPVPPTTSIEYPCARCGNEAELPVKGQPIAMLQDGGVIFDSEDYALPREIRCRKCRRVFTTDARSAA